MLIKKHKVSKIKLLRRASFSAADVSLMLEISINSVRNLQVLHNTDTSTTVIRISISNMASLMFQIFAMLSLIFCMLMHQSQCLDANIGATLHHHKVIVDCLNRPDNTGKFSINVYFFANKTQGWRAKSLTGACSPGTFINFDVNEVITYLWIKAESSAKAFFKVTTQQHEHINEVYTHQSWSYAGKTAFITTLDHMPTVPTFPGFPSFTKCDDSSGAKRNGWCELAGSTMTNLTTIPPYKATVHGVALTPPSSQTAFAGLSYVGITKGGALGQYWDYRNNTWFSDDCYTFRANFSDGHSVEVTCPTRDFTSKNDASTLASNVLMLVKCWSNSKVPS